MSTHLLVATYFDPLNWLYWLMFFAHGFGIIKQNGITYCLFLSLWKWFQYIIQKSLVIFSYNWRVMNHISTLLHVHMYTTLSKHENMRLTLWHRHWCVLSNMSPEITHMKQLYISNIIRGTLTGTVSLTVYVNR